MFNKIFPAAMFCIVCLSIGFCSGITVGMNSDAPRADNYLFEKNMAVIEYHQWYSPDGVFKDRRATFTCEEDFQVLHEVKITESHWEKVE
jgi:hypothetical protein